MASGGFKRGQVQLVYCTYNDISILLYCLYNIQAVNKICLLLLRGVNGRFNEYKMMVIKNFVTLSLEDDCLTVLVCLFFLSLLFLSCLSLKITNRRFRDKLVQVIDSEQKATSRKLFKKSFFQIL